MIDDTDMSYDFKSLLDAVDEIMGLDKGPSEEEWVEWCNRYLPLVQHYGRQKFVERFE